MHLLRKTRRFFQQYVDEGYQIIYISISSDFSSGYQNACLAAREFADGQVDVVDSRNLSTGIGLLVMKAVDLLKAGKGKAEIVNHLNEIIPLVRTAFIIDNMDYLHRVDAVPVYRSSLAICSNSG